MNVSRRAAIGGMTASAAVACAPLERTHDQAIDAPEVAIRSQSMQSCRSAS